jgi:hypothetical protein
MSCSGWAKQATTVMFVFGEQHKEEIAIRKYQKVKIRI